MTIGFGLLQGGFKLFRMAIQGNDKMGGIGFLYLEKGPILDFEDGQTGIFAIEDEIEGLSWYVTDCFVIIKSSHVVSSTLPHKCIIQAVSILRNSLSIPSQPSGCFTDHFWILCPRETCYQHLTLNSFHGFSSLLWRNHI